MQVTFPGVFIEETSAAGHAITGVPTSTAAFVGATLSGPVDTPLKVHSFVEFQAQFGGLAADMPLGYAVQQYFLNGGRETLIARIAPSGAALTDADLSEPALEAQRRGLWLLERAEHFEILCIPPLTRATDVGRATWDAAIALAERRRAMVIVDPPAAWTSPTLITEAAIAAVARRSPNAALYYPRLQAPDALQSNQLVSFAPSGAIAGVYARTDTNRGVWKAPAGTEASVLGAQGLSTALSEAQLSALEALGVNGLRIFPGIGMVVWGARTLVGSDGVATPYKFVPVRRLALFVETSLSRGLQWVVFEPNSEPTWTAIRASVGVFLQGLFKQGALQGDTPDEAFFVRCDASTMTQQDIDSGHIVVLVGLAPLKPAEFIILQIGISTNAHRHYSLRVEWDGQTIAGVTRVRGLGQRTELVNVVEGGEPGASHPVVGRTSFEPVVIARPLTDDAAFRQWADAMRASGPGSGAPAPRKDVRIEFRDLERAVAVAWRLISALPVKYQAPDLNAEGTDVPLEELTLVHEGLQRDPP
jgi:Bacteriophage tail sheath protein